MMRLSKFKLGLFLFLILILLIVGINFWLRSGAYYHGAVSDHFDGRHFFDPVNPRSHSFFDVWKWKLTAERKEWPEFVGNEFADVPPARVEGKDLRLAFVGHASFLIQTEGLNILTDPIWSERASPISWMGPKRVRDPGIDLQDLPKIDVVIVSHNHYDHMDIPTLRLLWERDQPIIITPLGNDVVMQRNDSSVVIQTLDWNQALAINKDVSVHLVPNQHWSARTLWDRNRALWGAYVINTPSGKIYFAGDTGYGNGKHFQDIKKQFGELRLALLPIGAYQPEWFMRYSHLNPEEAILAYQDLGSPPTVGMHFGTFQMADDGYLDPLVDLDIARNAYQISAEQFRTMEVGEVWDVP